MCIFIVQSFKNKIMTRFTLWSKPVAFSLLKNQRWTRFSVKDDDGTSSLLEMHSHEILKFFQASSFLCHLNITTQKIHFKHWVWLGIPFNTSCIHCTWFSVGICPIKHSIILQKTKWKLSVYIGLIFFRGWSQQEPWSFTKYDFTIWNFANWV